MATPRHGGVAFGSCEQVSRLPRAKQQFVMQMLDTVLQQAS